MNSGGPSFGPPIALLSRSPLRRREAGRVCSECCAGYWPEHGSVTSSVLLVLWDEHTRPRQLAHVVPESFPRRKRYSALFVNKRRITDLSVRL